MTVPQSRYIARIVDLIESRIRERPTAGLLDSETVDALDVVNHALSFTRHPRALELWREALWQRKLSDGTRQAVVEMFEYLHAAVARGETSAVAQICDCLAVFLSSEARTALEPSPHSDDALIGFQGLT